MSTRAIWQPAYIGIGSNLETPSLQVRRAWERLKGLPDTRAVRCSPLYRSRPFGPLAQPQFVNAVAGVLTRLDARALLGELKAIERAFGRPPDGPRWGPRIIDLDLLVCGRERRADPDLVLPHPGIVERNFVLYPLADLAPDLDVPGLGRVIELKARVAPEGLWRLEEPEPH
jgi:2-amino-4-hydroxy-6-hydroxymethyldihydropteridine diphosphokinase